MQMRMCERERERERLQKNKKASPQFVKLDFHDEMSCYKNEFAKLVFCNKNDDVIEKEFCPKILCGKLIKM